MRRNILSYLEDTVERLPHKLAFSDTKNTLTFQELHEQAQAVGTYVANCGIYGKPIVIFMEKKPVTLAAFFGTVYSGNYYVPIDSEMPKSRIDLIFQSLNPELVIVDEKTEKIAQSFCDTEKVQLFSSLVTTPKNQDILTEIRDRAVDIDPIYIIFTSGSTGMPKGVIANHRSVIDYIEELTLVLNVSEDSIFGNQAPLYVDACLKEVLSSLKYGATTYFIPKSLFMFPVKLIDFLNEYEINTICWVVTALTIISSLGGLEAKAIEHLHTIAFGSEVFPMKQFLLWREHLPKAQFIHLYGPTEATGMSTFYKVTDLSPQQEKIPIGGPFPNTEIKLLDENLIPLKRGEVGKVGEICIRGTCLTMGYYNDFEKTDGSFIQNPEVTAYRDLLYRTGDLGEYNEKGELLYHGRLDHQIKHMGHRVELAEIEVAASGLEGVSLTCAVYHKEEKQLLLYYVGDMEGDQVVKKLKTVVPRYMLPSKAHKLEEMPLTPNGKIDRNLLKSKDEKGE